MSDTFEQPVAPRRSARQSTDIAALPTTLLLGNNRRNPLI
jgi:hypothetical protein